MVGGKPAGTIPTWSGEVELSRNGRARRSGRPASGPLLDGRRKALLRGIVNQVRTDNVVLLAAGVAFFAMLALVPALGAAVSLYGLVATRDQVDRLIASLATTLPPEGRQIIAVQLRSITSSSASGLGLGLGLGLSAALWSASSGMRWLLVAMTAASGESESRKFLKLRALALLLTFGAILAIGISLTALLALPAQFHRLGLGGLAGGAANVLRFPALMLLMIAGLAVLYRYGPDRHARPRSVTDRKWMTWGSGAAATIWVLGSIGLSSYATSASKFQAAGTYGALGAVVVLLLWLFVTSFAVIFGAVVNAQIGRTGPPTSR
ncbi:MAG: YihY/virulence factor BrkB family protein [Actinomycetota bacterium]|nr:YihY/virulence factor BrkB family protein [Actinomycetota bacterium]